MREITIVLEDSTYAHGFSEPNQIHDEDCKKVMSLIRKQVDSCGKEDAEEPLMLSHPYNTIGVFGDRGSGKTSFLVSLLKRCKDGMPKVEVLRIIDPTLVEHKKPIVLCVIAMINELVTQKLQSQECSIDSTAFVYRKQWNQRVRDLSVGLFAIEEVGRGYDDQLWQDGEYVMHTGLDKVNKSNNFELSIRLMIDEALRILEKDAFLLAFDDIDMDVEQGWGVMEHLRRYLSYKKLITIVSGNIKLYGTLVRQKLTENLRLSDNASKQMLVNELESQYMLKLINPSNRINLSPMLSVVKNRRVMIKDKQESDAPRDIAEVYREVLRRCGIVGASAIKTFTEFFYSMSLRSQIHFLKDAESEVSQDLPMGVFTSRLYEAGIDVNWLKDCPRYTNISIMSYLQRTGNHTDGYLLLPTQSDKDTNCNFVGLTILANHWFRQSPQGLFDYMLRVGYIRNLLLPLTDKSKAKSLYSYGGWSQLMSLKNNIGLTMAYMLGTQNSTMNEHICLSGLRKDAKKDVGNALDDVLNKETDKSAKLLAMFPFVRLKHNRKNGGENYYSLFILLSAICDLLGCETEEEMASRINDLKLFRSYQMPLEGETTGEMTEISGDDYGISVDPQAMKDLAQKMIEWKNRYIECSIPPFVVGRIMTRVFTSVCNVKGETVGDMMNLMVCNLFNASLIEESRVRDIPGSGNQEVLNNNNLETTTKVLLDNLGKERTQHLPFSQWLMSCPMLICFLEEDAWRVKPNQELMNVVPPVYKLLKQISMKDVHNGSPKLAFSGSKDNWKVMRKVMNDNGITDENIQSRIVEPDINEALYYIKGLDMFSNPRKRSVESFRTYFSNRDV